MSSPSSGFFGKTEYATPETRALSSIADAPEIGQHTDFQRLIQQHDASIKFLATNQQKLQQGVNDATQNPVQQLQQFISDLVVLFGGGELAQGLLDFGDLKYLLPALGALFGFGSGPYPVNLLQAAEKFFLGYIVPSEQYADLLTHFIDTWAGFAGIDPKFVKDVDALVTAVADLFDGVHNLLPSMQSLLSALGLGSGRDLGPLGQSLNSVLHLFNGVDTSLYTDITHFVTGVMDTFVVNLTAVINWIDEVLRIFGSGGDVVNSPIGDITAPFADLVSNIATLFANFTTILSATGQASIAALGAFIAQIQNLIDGFVNLFKADSSTSNPVSAVITAAQNALGGLIPSMIDNLDGTITTLTGFIDNGDGTLSFTPSLGDIHTVIDNLDGTITSVAGALQNIFSGAHSAGSSVIALANALPNLNSIGEFAVTAVTTPLGGPNLSDDLSAVATTLFGAATTAEQVLSTSIENALGGGSLGEDLGDLATTLMGAATSAGQVLTTAIETPLGGSDLGADLTAVATTLFGAATTASQVLGSAVSGLESTGNDIVTDVQHGIDYLVNIFTGGGSSGNAPAAIAAAAAAIPHRNIVPPVAGTGTITHDASSNGTPVTGTSTTLSITPWSHTVDATADYLIVRVAVEIGSPSNFFMPNPTFGSQAMSLLTSEPSTALSGCRADVLIFGLANPTAGTGSISVSASGNDGTPIYAMQAAADSYIGVGSIGITPVTAGANGSPSQVVSSATDHLVVQALAVIANTTETLSSYSQTSRYNPGSTSNSSAGAKYLAMLAGDGAGASSVTLSATASFTTTNEWASAAVDLIPAPGTPLGSGFRQYRVSTGTTTAFAGDNLLPNSFLDTNDYITDDLTSTPGTHNELEVNYGSRYIVTIACELATQGIGNLQAVLYQNGGVVRRGQQIDASSVWNFCATFIVNCQPGDILQPGYNYSHGSGTNPTLTGEATGTSTYWEVCLLNRGILS